MGARMWGFVGHALVLLSVTGSSPDHGPARARQCIGASTLPHPRLPLQAGRIKHVSLRTVSSTLPADWSCHRARQLWWTGMHLHGRTRGRVGSSGSWHIQQVGRSSHAGSLIFAVAKRLAGVGVCFCARVGSRIDLDRSTGHGTPCVRSPVRMRSAWIRAAWERGLASMSA